MIIQEEVSSPVITSIGATPSKFKIKASAKAFKILSGFYSEPILAIPRELGANAWDAHVKAKNTGVMFKVHAPNQLEPWFSIRDFGTGLSPENIDQIYTTYFESTKTSDNDSDGCMGLGSKTPFNYTDNFTVTSWFNGTKYVYNCFIDGAGAPNILAVCNEPTTEHNGMEIKFGVKIADITMFVEKIQRAYDPFRFRPVIVGASITYAPREYIFENTTLWGMRKGADRYNRSQCRAFMGNYSYPISYDAISGYIRENIKDSNVSGKIYNILSQTGHFDLFFNIGDLEVAPNKEQLQYDGENKTAKAIVDRVIVIVDELKAIVDKSLAVPSSRWEAMSLYARYNSHSSEWGTVRRVIGDIEVNYQGEKIGSSSAYVDYVNEALKLVAPKSPNSYSANKLPDKFYFGLLHHKSHTDKFTIRETSQYHVTEAGGFPVFLYTNEDNLKRSRIRHFLKGRNGQGIIPDSILVIDKSKNFSVFKAHCKYFGIPDTTIFNIEDLPRPPKVPRVPKTASTNEIEYCDISHFSKNLANSSRYSSSNTVYWNRKANTFNATDTYYYVDFYYTNPWYNNQVATSEVGLMIRYLKLEAKCLPVDIVYGINKKNKGLLKVGNWINVMDIAKKTVEKKKEKFEQALYLSTLSSEYSNFSRIRQIIAGAGFINSVKNKKTAALFQDFLDLGKEFHDAADADVNLISVFYKIKEKCHTPVALDLKEFKKTVTDKYMNIFNMVDPYYSNSTQIAKLINFIDENV